MLLICLDKELCMSNTWSKREKKRKVTFRIGENEKEIDKERTNVKAIPWEFQHALVVVDIGKKIRNVVRKTCTERRKISLLKDLKVRKRLEEKVIKIVSSKFVGP